MDQAVPYRYRAKIVEVYDGDTVTALVDLGFRTQVKLKLRLFGINAPEIAKWTRVNGEKSRDYLASLVLDKDVVIDTFKDKTEKYGRFLAKIMLIKDSNLVEVNQMMIDSGHAGRMNA